MFSAQSTIRHRQHHQHQYHHHHASTRTRLTHAHARIRARYTDVWCNMTTAGGPDGCRAFILHLDVTLVNGTRVHFYSNTADWKCRQGPTVWDHLFHGETYDSRLEADDWNSLPLPVLEASAPPGTWGPVVVMDPPGPTQEGNISTLGPLVRKTLQLPPALGAVLGSWLARVLRPLLWIRIFLMWFLRALHSGAP